MKNNTEKKIIGVIGGMGPLATVDLYRKIVEHTDADCDQAHVRTIIDSNTNIPDRTAALLSGGESPVKELQSSARLLEQAGAQVLVMPCNTAHCFYDAVQACVGVPILNMIELTVQALKRQSISRAGLLATDGTVQSGIYQKHFEARGIELLLPDPEDQAAIMDMIYRGVKAGCTDYDTSRVRSALDRLLACGAQTLILGCTELPPAFEMYGLNYPDIDPTLELALAAISAAGGKLK